ncbi:hypothetical protein HAX54_046768 [Datura stramonium]|uniref:Uncharacterized protein n=1 Tax=Datura stramonium TaxID=4076 RepID=A0ABS8WHJ3_DATST|nr:hypothetical protein [Datura stramonium]
MMAPSGASGSGSGDGAGGRGFSLTDLFGSSSPGNSEAGLNQPAPDSHNPGEPAAPPIAKPYHLLQEDGERRRFVVSLNQAKYHNSFYPSCILSPLFRVEMTILFFKFRWPKDVEPA